MASKRKNISFGENNIEILKSFWNKGMSGYGDENKKALLTQAALQTGVEESRIKDWIGNYRKKQMGIHGNKNRLKRKPPSGYNLFISKVYSEEVANGNTDRKQIFKKGANLWHDIKEKGQEAIYIDKAKELQVPKPSEMSAGQKKVAIGRIISEMHGKFDKLHDLGVECAAMFSTPGNIFSGGTKRGTAFLDSRGLINEFSNYVEGIEPVARSKKDLKKDVQMMFNDKFRLETGKRQVPYRECDQGLWSVKGLPIGVKFQRPSYYGIEALRNILARKESITITSSSNASVTQDDQRLNEPENGNMQEEIEERLNELEDGNMNEEIEATDIEELCESVGVVPIQKSTADVPVRYTVDKIMDKRYRGKEIEFMVIEIVPGSPKTTSHSE